MEAPGTTDTMITGYQWRDNMEFGGEYIFPNNLDKDEIHMPPRTTLIAPPKNIPPGHQAYWTGSAWGIREEIRVMGGLIT